MFNKKFIIVAIVSLFNGLSKCAENVDFTYCQYNINDIKRFSIVESCKTIGDCPSFAVDCSTNGECIYPEYACSGNQKCYALNSKKNYNYFLDDDEKTSYTALDENNKTTKIIAKSCNTSKSFDRDYDGEIDTCTTAKCSSNDECLSNKCVSGMCQINQSSPTYHCKVNGPYYTCNQLLDEHCVSDNGCASYRCHETDYICVKEFQPEKEESSSSSSSTYIIIACLIVLVILIVLILCCCKNKKKSGKSRDGELLNTHN